MYRQTESTLRHPHGFQAPPWTGGDCCNAQVFLKANCIYSEFKVAPRRAGKREQKRPAVTPTKQSCRLHPWVPDSTHVDGFHINHSRFSPCGVHEQRHSLKKRASGCTHTALLLSTLLPWLPCRPPTPTASI